MEADKNMCLSFYSTSFHHFLDNVFWRYADCSQWPPYSLFSFFYAEKFKVVKTLRNTVIRK